MYMQFFDRSGNRKEKPANREIKDRTSAYGICIRAQKILVVQPVWNALWELPGGGIEPNETVEEALLREFIEETGYSVIGFDPNPLHRMEQHFYAVDLDEYFHSSIFFFSILKLSEQNSNSILKDEIARVEWVNLSELNEHTCKRFNLDVIRSVVGKLPETQ